MTTRPNALIQAACISLLLMLVPGTAAPQEQKEPAGENQPEKAAGEPAMQTPGSLSIPGGNTEQQPAEPKPAASPAPAPAQEPSGPAKEESAEYIIKRGDTLWDISNAFFKDPFLWPFIWKANPYITNADLIYPGNKLVIPSLAPIERALEAPEEQVVEKQAPPAPEAKPQEGIAAAGVRPKAPPAVSEEAPAEGGRLILPEEQPQPIVDKYAMLSAGFVNDEENVGSIVGAEERGKTLLGYDDIVYVKMGSPENVNVGDKFLVYRPLGKVNHPKGGGSYGRLIRGLGILQITAKDPAADVLTARITLSFSDIGLRSRLTPYQEPVLIYHSEKRDKDISGYILEVTDHRTLVGQTDFVYLDKGRADGVDPGDQFIVYARPQKSGFPRKVVGEVQVFLVKERTSTAVVRKSREPLARGEAVDFKK